MIVSVYSTIVYCNACKEHVITISDVFINYFSLTQLNSLNINVCSWSSALTSCNTPNFLQCISCKSRCQRIETQSNSSVILLVKFSTDIINHIHFDWNIAVSGDTCVEGMAPFETCRISSVRRSLLPIQAKALQHLIHANPRCT